MLEDLVLVAPLSPNAVVKALEQVPAIASALACVQRSEAILPAARAGKQAEEDAVDGPGRAMQGPLWRSWAPPCDRQGDGVGYEGRGLLEASARAEVGTEDIKAKLPASSCRELEKSSNCSTAEPAAIRIQPANGWDQIVCPQPTADEMTALSRAPWSFGDGTVSLIELVTGVNFQVYMGIHMWALVAVINWCSWRLAALCALMYILKMFGITGGFHRLLSHRSYKTSRVGQFVMACLGCCAFQKGPLWWCSHHRHHHRTADTEEDAHSPVQHGFWWSHVGWFLCSTHNVQARVEAVPDLLRWPELRWLDKYHFVPPFLLAAALYIFGGWPAVGWGFMLSNVLAWHATYCINSLAHLIGSRRYTCEFQTHCDARNNLWLAVATLGEGWHNNHHCYMRSAKHGFYPHEIDITYAILRALACLGLVWDLEMPPMEQLEKKRLGRDQYACRCSKVEDDLQQIARG